MPTSNEDKLMALTVEMSKNLAVIQQKISMIQADVKMLQHINDLLETS